MSQQQQGKVGVGEKIGYGVADLANGLYLNFFGVFAFYYFVDIGGVAPAAIALMLLLSKLLDAITDPMMGAIADRTRTRWGRYRPYLLFGAIPFALCGASVFLMPELEPGSMLVWAYVTYGLAMLAYTAVNVPYGGLLGVISPSSAERASVTAYRMFFSAASGILLGLLGTTLIRELGGGDEARGILLTMTCIGLLGAICIWISFVTTKERIPPTQENGSVMGDLSVLVRSAPWIAVAVAAILGVLAIASRASSARFYFKYVTGDDGSPVWLFLDRLGLFLTALAIGQIAGVVLGNALQKRFEKRNILIAGGALKALGILVFYALPLDAFWGQTAAQLLVGIGFGFLMVMAYSMFTDIAEYIDWKSGLQMTGLVVAASVFAVKVGVGLGAAVPGFTMGLTGFDPDKPASVEALMGIEMSFSLIPALALIPAVVALLFYRLDRATIAEVEAGLAARRAGEPVAEPHETRMFE